MPNAATLGSIMWEVLAEGRERTFKPEEVNSFYTGFQADVSEEIEVIRSEQRRAYDEGRNLILS